MQQRGGLPLSGRDRDTGRTGKEKEEYRVLWLPLWKGVHLCRVVHTESPRRGGSEGVVGYDYFYGRQVEQYQFYKLPKILIKEESLKKISMDAKVLYSLMLDRASLSAENEWLDDKGRVYIIYTLDEICKDMCCAREKAVKLLKELEEGCDLIRRKHQRLCKPNLIYVMNFASDNRLLQKELKTNSEIELPGVRKSDCREFENRTAGDSKTELPGVRKPNANNTDNSNTENNHNISSDMEVKASDHIIVYSDELEKRDQYRKYFYNQLDLPILIETFPYSEDRINEIVELLVDVCSGDAEKIRINEEAKPGSVVRSVLMDLNYMHISYVLHSLDETKSEIRNMRGYLLTILYNAPMSMNSYFQAKINHDMESSLLLGEGDKSG